MYSFFIGIHGEARPYTFLFALFFWDILFNDTIADVFIVPFQTAPLDLMTGNIFFKNRKIEIESRLLSISNYTIEVK